jgi:hypothetical protein
VDDLNVQVGGKVELSAHAALGLHLGSLAGWDLGRYSLSYGVSGAKGSFTVESDTVLNWPERVLDAVESLADIDLVDAAESSLLMRRTPQVKTTGVLDNLPALSLDGNAGIKSVTKFRAGSLPLDWERVDVDVQAVWDLLGTNLLDSAFSASGLRRLLGADPVPLSVDVKSAAESFATSGDIDGTAWGLSYHLPSPESALK